AALFYAEFRLRSKRTPTGRGNRIKEAGSGGRLPKNSEVRNCRASARPTQNSRFMCGIAGFTHERWRVDRNTIVRITASLAHRGPDQQGIFESPHVSLGAVRLKIIDLCGGDQPFASDDGETVIVFNGEIYNHRDLRQELERCGHKFRTQCDTEVVLEAFREWDTDCFLHLRGMFAIAVWS